MALVLGSITILCANHLEAPTNNAGSKLYAYIGLLSAWMSPYTDPVSYLTLGIYPNRMSPPGLDVSNTLQTILT